MSNDFKERCKLPESYRKALDELAEKRKVVERELEKIKETFKKQYGREMTLKEINDVRVTFEQLFDVSASFELSEEELINFTSDLSTVEQEKVYMQFITDQAKGFFQIIELMKEQIISLIESNEIDANGDVRIISRVKGLESAIKNEASNTGKKKEERYKILDDVFGITIVAKSKEDVQTIRKRISNKLIKVTLPKTISKPIKGEDGKSYPGYNAYHDYGYLMSDKDENPAERMQRIKRINEINIDEYRALVEGCIGEENDSRVTQEEFCEMCNKTYTSLDEFPAIEIHYQTEEEFERANGVASHSKYKQSTGQESVVNNIKKYLNDGFHRFVDIPLMFEWTSRNNIIRLLDKNEVLFLMHPYLEKFKDVRESMSR